MSRTKGFVTDPNREDRADSTGIYCRAIRPNGEWDAVDIAELDADSLWRFLRSECGCSLASENVVGILLGHGHLHADYGWPAYLKPEAPMVDPKQAREDAKAIRTIAKVSGVVGRQDRQPLFGRLAAYADECARMVEEIEQRECFCFYDMLNADGTTTAAEEGDHADADAE